MAAEQTLGENVAFMKLDALGASDPVEGDSMKGSSTIHLNVVWTSLQTEWKYRTIKEYSTIARCQSCYGNKMQSLRRQNKNYFTWDLTA